MKEIVYIQAGEFSNYVGTHFWNTQESYFTYDTEDEPLTSHDISFREGLAGGEPTFCPRLLAFDRKANFGTLATNNVLLGMDNGNQDATPWGGNVVEYRQDPIEKSAYQTEMEDSSADPQQPGNSMNNPLSQLHQSTGEIRYWSDFSRVYYVPRTIQKLPDPPDWDLPNGDWNKGVDSFVQYNESNDVMDGSLRLFLEECDNLQGIQVINDANTFGSFISTFLTSFRDELLKLPSLVFPLLSSSIPGQIDVDDYQGTKNVINDSLHLRSLYDLSAMTIPVQAPSHWSRHVWSSGLTSTRKSKYEQSALLSSHIESSTLPLRMRGAHEDISSFSAQLNWRGTIPFGELMGAFPVTSPEELQHDVVNFSAYSIPKVGIQHARIDVTRGFSPSFITGYENWSANSKSIPQTLVSRFHAPAYPLPTSFPSFFNPAANVLSPSGSPYYSYTTKALSSVTSSTTTASLLKERAIFIEACVKRRAGAVVASGIESDELKDLVNDLWTMHDNHIDDDGELGREGNDGYSGVEE
ncbi:mtDNA inheritance protein Dml1 [Cyathus striatus]|nr:mtDNA inheritance protein Dml1 [Cyathus striatus]